MEQMEKEELFNDMYKRKLKFVKGYCRRYTSREQSEELAHDIFLNFYKSLDTFRNDSKLETWLYSITKNACSNFFRAEQSFKRKGFTISLDGGAVYEDRAESGFTAQEFLHDRKFDIDKRLSSQDMLVLVKTEIENLPSKHRKCFYAFMEEDGFRSYRDAAEILGVSETTARSRITRSRELLKKRLARMAP